MRTPAAALGAIIAMIVVGAGSGSARAQEWIRLRGRIQAVDCRANTLTIDAPGETQVLRIAPDAIVRLNTFRVAVCALRPFVGSRVFARIAPVGNQVVAARVDVFSAAYAAGPPPVYYPCCLFYPGFGLPGIGISIGFGFGPGSHHPDPEDR